MEVPKKSAALAISAEACESGFGLGFIRVFCNFKTRFNFQMQARHEINNVQKKIALQKFELQLEIP